MTRLEALKAQVNDAVPAIVRQTVAQTVDIQEKVRVYLITYGAAMQMLKQKEPEVWADILNATKIAYKKDPTLPNVIVEMIAANTIEYQEALLEGNVSPLSAQLHAFAKENNLLFR